jgi:RNA polymerase sigma factor (sigma-70 family)
MDYSELVTAIKQNDSDKINKLLGKLRPRLLAFLRIHMNADEADAQDCAQETLLASLDIIKEDRIDDPDQVISYLLSTCKNIYLKLLKKRREKSMDEVSEKQLQAPGQLQSLLNEEQKRLLKWCMDQLKEEYRNFMEYWFTHPNANADSVAERFNISVSNVWTRKHRLVKKLNECYQKKM